MQQAASPLRLYFLLYITMRYMVETQYDAAGCLSTASLLPTLYFTSYFILPTSYFLRPPLVMPALRSFAKVDLETQFIY
jgi:hypothetical protein